MAKARRLGLASGQALVSASAWNGRAARRLLHATANRRRKSTCWASSCAPAHARKRGVSSAEASERETSNVLPDLALPIRVSAFLGYMDGIVGSAGLHRLVRGRCSLTVSVGRGKDRVRMSQCCRYGHQQSGFGGEMTHR